MKCVVCHNIMHQPTKERVGGVRYDVGWIHLDAKEINELNMSVDKPVDICSPICLLQFAKEYYVRQPRIPVAADWQDRNFEEWWTVPEPLPKKTSDLAEKMSYIKGLKVGDIVMNLLDGMACLVTGITRRGVVRGQSVSIEEYEDIPNGFKESSSLISLAYRSGYDARPCTTCLDEYNVAKPIDGRYVHEMDEFKNFVAHLERVRDDIALHKMKKLQENGNVKH